MAKGISNNLAIEIDEFIKSKGIRKTFIAKEMNISASYFQKLMQKDNFTIDDANRILSVIGYRIDYSIKSIEKE